MSKYSLYNFLSRTAASLCAAMLVTACANMGTPSGGPRDEDPPLFVSSNPAPASLNVERNRITLTFSELVNVKDAFQKVVVSPVGGPQPKVTATGKRVTVEFDSLMPNTTYTIDFGDAIEDNTEGNKLQGFAYTFSTGATLDTLRMSGRVLGARDLEPRKEMLVGVMSDLSDSAFMKRPLLRVAKTDDRGRFVVRGLAPGKYRVFALDDKDGDYTYANPEEDLAFYPVTVSPRTESATALDSLFNPLTGALDSVLTRRRTRYLPNDILLRAFNSQLRRQYLQKYERLDSARVFFKFNAPNGHIPTVRAIGYEGMPDIGIVETRRDLDSLIFWLRPQLMREDSLQLAVTYEHPDSAGNPVMLTDTLKFFDKAAIAAAKQAARKRKNSNRTRLSPKDSIARITTAFNMISQPQQDVNMPLEFEIATPPAAFDTTAVHLEVMVDSVYRPVTIAPRIRVRDGYSPRTFRLEYPWDYGRKYRMTVDTLATVDIYGKPTRPLVHEFTVKEEGEYCALTLNITGLGTDVPAFVELLNTSDSPVRTARVENGRAYFPFLHPGRYYARIIEDLNGNGEYDTGNYAEGRQPEVAYYYPKAINLKKNWDKEEAWNVFETAIDLQKPAAILKNKPQQRKRIGNEKKDETDEEDEDFFDPTRNPFDPNDKGRRRNTVGSY